MLNYILVVFSVVLFFQGFFPVNSPHFSENDDPPSSIKNISLSKQISYKTNITKTVLVVIDALRLDFVKSDYMPLTSNLIRNNGCFNKIKVETPTVTLPRIKALTVGNIPQFLDLVFNLVNTEHLADSVIHSAVRENKKIVFYGDNTWLKLYPNHFSRFEGTNSFFVRDFKEVDDNVTRNVHIELENSDWDIMILHYLGLDHIGHVYGPFSTLIPSKLSEMDNIIYNIFEHVSKKTERTLLLVTGDHGMKDSGGHGGSTFSETHVPLVVIGHQCENTSFAQTDIPVNLAVLLGLRIPSLAIGKVQKKLLNFDIKKYLYALHYNSVLLKQKDACCNDLFDEAVKYHIELLKDSNYSSGLEAEKLYDSFLNKIVNNLSKASMEQNLQYLVISFFVMLNMLVILLVDIVFSDPKQNNICKYIMIIVVVLQFIIRNNPPICLLMVIILISIFFKNLIFLVSLNWGFTVNILHFFCFVCVLHPITFISSSYIEEEHQFWYFFNMIFIFFQLIHFLKIKSTSNIIISLICFGCFRFLRRLKSTGDKWATYPDLSSWFLKDENYFWYQLVAILGVILVFITQYVLIIKKTYITFFLNGIIILLILVFKHQESNYTLGRVIWLFIAIQFVSTYQSKIITWILIVSLLMKLYNLILLPYCVFSSLYFSEKKFKTESAVLYHIFLSNMLYFAQGHSNSLASIDVSVGYVGLSEYQPILVMCQILCHTQAFPVLCHMLILRDSCIDTKKMWKILFCNKLFIFFVTSTVTFIFRHHLFIWSVFAPKLFLELAQVLFLFVEYLCFQAFKLTDSFCTMFMCKLKQLSSDR